jgi:hypothetical protein
MLVLRHRWSNSFLARGVLQDRPDLKKGLIFLSRKIIFHPVKLMRSEYLLKIAMLIARDEIDRKVERSLFSHLVDENWFAAPHREPAALLGRGAKISSEG